MADKETTSEASSEELEIESESDSQEIIVTGDIEVEEKLKATKEEIVLKTNVNNEGSVRHVKRIKNLINDEENAKQVQERFEKGCECQEENCFRGLSAEFVYRHRLNIAELTKSEHDMYLMGVTMAVLTNPEETMRHKERRRLRSQYAFQGRRVCLDAFLYLENCSHYQLKRIRKHIMTHGVTPRVHGNHGKRPHNTLPLDIYRHATAFLQHYIEKHALPDCPSKKTPKTLSNIPKHKQRLVMPGDITRKTIHNAYKEFCEHFEPNIKVMGYSTFRYFMKEQFPKLRFPRNEQKNSKQDIISKITIPAPALDQDETEEIDIEGDTVKPEHQHTIIIGINGELSETSFFNPSNIN